jgi:predicted ribosome quality control (RQC) complex YloA/Tae2 family protein
VSLPIEYPVLSYRELSRLIELVSPRLIGSRIERVFVPSLVEHPDGFFKREWALDLYSETGDRALFEFSLKPQAAGLIFHERRNLKPGQETTRSGFDLSLHKHFTGGKITKLTQITGDRAAILEIQNAGETYELHLHLMPAKPYGVLLQKTKTRELLLLASTDQRESYETPKARVLSVESEAKIPYREERIQSVGHYEKLWSDAKKQNALSLRQNSLEHRILQDTKTIQKKMDSLAQQLKESQEAPNWNTYGTLLQIHFYQKPVAKDGFYTLLDYESGEEKQIPADPKLDLKAQLEKFFHLAKRNKKRLSETEERIESLAQKKGMLTQKLERVKKSTKLADFLELEPPKTEALKGKVSLQVAEFSGKQYRSKEGLTILSGRNLTENLQLTFKIARGNDLWFHVKGKPGSHTVVLLPPKRTASLETLLDAADVCILHSGGKDWGKTEVDYTYRKYVKKIKNQTEVSYTHNKTLAITPDPERVKRLFSEET